MAATATYMVTVPGKVSSILARKAKVENVSVPEAILSLIEDAIEYAEEHHIWEEALERERTCTGDLIPMSEIWTPEHGLRNPL